MSNEITAIGRRKTAVARVKLKPGTGKFTINDKELKDYLTVPNQLTMAIGPLGVSTSKFDITVKAEGGGIAGQAGAIRLGIARALIKVDAALRGTLKSKGMLKRDPRMRERKKYGQPGARKRFQFSKR